jgi:hypothetical protein
MPLTYTLIASVTVGSGGAGSIDFTSIPSTYTDLCLLTSTRSNAGGSTIANIGLEFNSNTSGYDTLRLYGSGSSVTSDKLTSQTYIFAGLTDASTATANTFGSLSIYIPNYAGSANKSVSMDAVQENNTTAAYASLHAGLWNNTAAINTVKLKDVSGTAFVQYSTAYLYGIKNS